MNAVVRYAFFACVAATFCVALAEAPITLRDAYQDKFLIGAALNKAQFTEEDSRGAEIVKTQFNSITPENILKWESIHPRADAYAFDLPDQYVAFGERNHMFIVGHCLVWHNQVPNWVFRDKRGRLVRRAVLLRRMQEHIQAVVARYKGRIKSWDVVNEALSDDGSLRESLWLKIIGPDYIAKAFQYAHEADPDVQLIYNDYSLENEPKREGAIRLIRDLLEQHVPITSVGLQGHVALESPAEEETDATISDFARLGVKVVISELDVSVLPRGTSQQTAEITVNIKQNPTLNPYAAGLPDSVQDMLSKRYEGLFRVFQKHRDVVTRVTFWGVTDRDSWRNDWPVKGRTDYPLLFDREGQPKPALQAVLATADEKRMH
jgi:endo-1,4-beta-xylanase